MNCGPGDNEIESFWDRLRSKNVYGRFRDEHLQAITGIIS